MSKESIMMKYSEIKDYEKLLMIGQSFLEEIKSIKYQEK